MVDHAVPDRTRFSAIQTAVILRALVNSLHIQQMLANPSLYLKSELVCGAKISQIVAWGETLALLVN